MSFAQKIHNAIAVVAPIEGVSIGRKDDKATWRIDFSKSATADQMKAAREAIEAFDTGAEDKAGGILAQIVALEAQLTQRRLREARLGIDGGWLEDIDGKIEALKKQL